MLYHSIIMPCYNSANTIGASIESVISQSNQNWELVIVDDCSMDHSKDIIRRYLCGKKNIVLIENKNNIGVSAARNKGILAAKGDLIHFLDSDDIWLPTKLSATEAVALKNPSPLYYSDYFLFKCDLHSVAFSAYETPANISYAQLLNTCYIGTLTACIDTRIVDKATVGFEHTPKEDYVLWLKTLKKFGTAQKFVGYHAFYRTGNTGSLSGEKSKEIKKQWDVIRRFSGSKSFTTDLLRLAYYAINGLSKHHLSKKVEVTLSDRNNINDLNFFLDSYKTFLQKS